MCLAALQVISRVLVICLAALIVVLACVRVVRRTVSHCTQRASIFCFLYVAFLIGANVVPDFLVLLKQEPEHAVELLGCLDLHLRVRAHRAKLLLQIDDALDIMRLERGLVSHDVIVSANEVLLQLIVESLSADLDAYPQHNLDVYHLLLKSCL